MSGGDYFGVSDWANRIPGKKSASGKSAAV